ncbi:MAG: transcription-repair coupling factor [Ignavibacteria bacterium]|nr:transcription-repair coupling factor [Ignavibacteria bacterium]
MISEFRKIKETVFSSGSFSKLTSEISNKEKLTLSGVSGSLTAFIIASIFEHRTKKLLIISHDDDRIIKLKDDIDLLCENANISAFSQKLPDSEPYSKILIDLAEASDFIIVTSAGELKKKVVSKDLFKDSMIEIMKEQNIDFEQLIDRLQKSGFNRVDFVDQEGDFSVRGGIIDIFAENLQSPVRVEFFGDTVESIREFDINSQRSVKEVEHVKLGINVTTNDNLTEESFTENLVDYLPKDTLVLIDEPEITLNMVDEESLDKLSRYKQIGLTSFTNSMSDDSGNTINFHSKPQPDFLSNLRAIYNDISGKISEGYDVYILASDSHQADRIKELLEDFEDENVFSKDELIHHASSEEGIVSSIQAIAGKFTVLSESLHSGFILNDPKLLIYTEHQIFGRYFKRIRKRKQRFKGITFSELKELQYGDYVVHRDFGIGVYSGLKKITVGNNQQEVVQLSCLSNDTLFINLNSINLIKKYSGSEGHKPVLTRLGGGDWDKVKARTKKQVKDIARDLIILYAKRKTEKGHKYPSDTHWQKELEANFMYEDTPDQFRATQEAKEDMESENPMDRLVCGDVGFGKTEVALRAAFKAVMDNKQVAVLVPTTILAVQHYNTFRDRLTAFAVEVDNITRLRSSKEQKEILARLAEGKLNILIGTHRILSKDIEFKNLGLLIIDEEQRFGVKAKEKLRALSPNVDTLTLTATPIPRTLNFSLLGARDLSIINTPPKNRKPIITEIVKLDWSNIATIIRNELARGGQVYFVNDKVRNLNLLGDTIKNYVPESRIGIAHGQMDGKELEEVVINFIEKKLNVLLCTKIIESGLDIPNVNTIIINNADMYGLAELYQLRGRVGRSDAQAFAYLIAPPDAKLTKTAVRRLQAIEEFTELGSGFNLAMRDMEIRGVGNLLGKEQSGFIQEIGFDMYISIIEEAVLELKENEFKDLFANELSLKKMNETIEKKLEAKSTIIENDLNALIPKDYVANDTERLNLYRRLYELTTEDELNALAIEMKDRFGEYLDDVENLLRIIRLKLKASEIGLEKIAVRGKTLVMEFPADKDHRIFESTFFNALIERLSHDKSRKYNIAPEKEKLVVEAAVNGNSDGDRLKDVEKIIGEMAKEVEPEQM